MPEFRTLATVRHHAMVLTDHEFEVPLDHARPSGEKLTLFARAVRSVKKSAADLPWLVFLQGGPGFPGPRPLTNSGWIKRALDDYRVGIAGMKMWLTNEFEHSGLRTSDRVFERLVAMLHDE